MHPLKVNNLSKCFTADLPVVNKVSFEIESGEIITVVGASGSGKTTLLRMLAGFEQPSQGSISINDKLVAGENQFVKPENRNVGFVFQDLALFPHLTVEKNIAFGIKKGSDKKRLIQELLELTGLHGFGTRYPWQLSGGQQQRVAIARALAMHPAVLLMDEPFSSLDQSLRVQLREEIRSILKKAGITTIIVTHDMADAYAMANRILVLEKGQLAQFDTPEQIYKYPANTEVAALGGKMNVTSKKELNLSESDNTQLMFRPENVQITGESGEWRIASESFNGKYYEYKLENNNTSILAHLNQRLATNQVFSIHIAEEHLIAITNER